MAIYPQTYVPLFDTIADMRALTMRPDPREYTYVYLKGGAAEFDGLQGNFVYNDQSQAVDDGVNVIKSNWIDASQNGRWLRQTPSAQGAVVLRQVAVDYIVTATDGLLRAIIEVDATAGPRMITYPVGLTPGCPVLVSKIDATAHPVNISADGVTILDSIVTPINGSNVGSRTVWSNGAAVRSSGVG